MLLKHGPMAYEYEHYGVNATCPHLPTARRKAHLKYWMEETSSAASHGALSLHNSPSLAAQATPSEMSELSNAGERAYKSRDFHHERMSDPHFVAGQLILTNIGNPNVSPPAHHEDREGQQERLLKMQEDVALVHEEIGMAPRSQSNSRAGSRLHSLSNSVTNSPALAPHEKEMIQDVVPVVLTAAAVQLIF